VLTKEIQMKTIHKAGWIRILATVGAIITGGGIALAGQVYEGLGIALAAIAGPQVK